MAAADDVDDDDVDDDDVDDDDVDDDDDDDDEKDDEDEEAAEYPRGTGRSSGLLIGCSGGFTPEGGAPPLLAVASGGFEGPRISNGSRTCILSFSRLSWFYGW